MFRRLFTPNQAKNVLVIWIEVAHFQLEPFAIMHHWNDRMNGSKFNVSMETELYELRAFLLINRIVLN